MNFAYHSDPEDHMGYSDIPNKVDITHLDVSDFFEDANGKIDHLIGDGNVHTNQHISFPTYYRFVLVCYLVMFYFTLKIIKFNLYFSYMQRHESY